MPASRRRSRNDWRPFFEPLEERIVAAYDVNVAVGYGTWNSATTPDIKTNAVVEDASGNMLVVGSWSGEAIFDTPGTTSSRIKVTNSRDGFLASFSSTGALNWVDTWNGSTNGVVQPLAVALDPSGNIVIAGGFHGTMKLDPSGSSSTSVTSQGSTDPFMIKLDSTGHFLWGNSAPGDPVLAQQSQYNALAIDGQGNIVVAGLFSSKITIGSNLLSCTPNSISTEACVAEFNSAGVCQWVLQSTGSSFTATGALGVTFDLNGDIGVTGYYTGSVKFASSLSPLVSNGIRDIFVEKIKANGAVLWAIGMGGSDVDQANAIAADSNGSFYVTGSYSTTVNFGTITNPISSTAGGLNDAYLLKVSSQGVVQWAQGLTESAGGVGQGNGVVVTPSGTVVISGWFDATLSVALGTNPIILVSPVSTTTDVFIVSFDQSGTPLSGRRLGGTLSDAASGIAVNPSGQVAVTGNYGYPASDFATKSIWTFETASFLASFLYTSTSTNLALIGGVGPSQNLVNSINVTIALSSIAVGSTVELYRNGTFVGRRIGPGNIVDSGAKSDGTYTYTARQFATNGDRSFLSSPLSVTILTTPPAPPSAPILLGIDDTGVQGDGITSVKRPRLTGTAPANCTIDLRQGSNVIGTTTADSLGNYTVQPTNPLNDGTYTLTTRATDVAGNVSSPSAATSLTILTTPPTAPTGLILLAADDSGVVGDGATNVTTPRFTGKAGANLTILLMDSVKNTTLAYVTSDAQGNFTIKPASPLTDGTYSIITRAVDVAGNVSNNSSVFTLTILTVPPATLGTAPLLLAADDSGTVGDGITNVRSPRFTGNASTGLTVQLIDTSTTTILGTSTAVSGNYAVQPSASLAAGTYNLAVRVVDHVGNISSNSPTFRLTIMFATPVAPSALSLLPADDSGAVGDLITNVTAPRLTGTSTAVGTLRLVLIGSNTVLQSIPFTGSNPFTIAPSVGLADGTYSLAANIVDVAGNIGAYGPSINLTILTAKPSAPAQPGLLAADDSGIVGDNITNVTKPRITGIAPAAGTLQLINTQTNAVLSSLSVTNGSTYQIAPTTGLIDGTYPLSTRVVDIAGNIGTLSLAVSISILTTSPAAPAQPSLLPADDSGIVGDNTTNATKPRLIGTATSTGTLQLVNTSSGSILNSISVQTNTSYQLAPTALFTDGTYALAVRIVDVAGNIGSSSPSVALTILTTPPAAPGLPVLFSADDSGAVGDGITNVTKPRFTITATANGTLQLLNVGTNVILNSVTVQVGSTYQLGPTAAFSDGVYSIIARVVDVAGNIGASSASALLTILTIAPSAPAAPTLLPADNSGSPGSNITNVTKPRVTGTATATGTLQLINSQTNSVLGTVAVTSGSVYQVAPTSAFANGTYLLVVRILDVAGNLGAQSSSLTLTILSSSLPTPAQPTLLPADDSGVLGDGITNVTKPRLTGTSTVGGTLQLVNVSTNSILNAIVVTANSSYQIASTNPMSDGTYTLAVRLTDSAGNQSANSPTFSLTILTPAPVAQSMPTLLPLDDSGVVGDNITNVKIPRLTGTSNAKGTLQLLNSATNTVLNSISVLSGASYQIAPGSSLADGVYSLVVRVVDVAGNVGAVSPSLSLTILSTSPPAPAGLVLLAADDSGIVGDGITNVSKPRLTGTASSSGTLQLVNTVTGAVINSAAYVSGSTYQIAPITSLLDGTYSLASRIVDVAGNVGVLSATVSLTILTATPATPGVPILFSADDSGIQGDGITNVAKPRFSIATSSGGTIQIINATTSVILGTFSASSSGTYQVTPTSALSDGTYSVAAIVVDIAGNASSTSVSGSVTILTAAPSAPAIPSLLPADDSGLLGDRITNVTRPRLTGTTNVSGSVQLINTATNTVLNTVAVTSGVPYQVVPTASFSEGVYSLATRVLDVAGNVGSSSPSLSITILTAIPTAPAKPSLLAADDSGTLGDNITNVAKPRLTGLAPSTGTLQLLSGSSILNSIAVTSGSTYQIAPTSAFGDGTYLLTTRIVDVAGNIGTSSPAITITILTTIPGTPAPPTILAADDSGVIGDNLTNVHKPHLIGSALAGQLVELLDTSNRVLASTTVAAGQSTYNLQWTTDPGYTTVTVRVRVTDVAGNVSLSSSPLAVKIIEVPYDFDGDGKADIGIFRPSTAQWIIMNSSGSQRISQFGATNLFDIPVAADFDGDGKADLGVFRPSTGQWLISTTSGNFITFAFGASNLADIPVPADYDGVGRAEFAIFRRATGQWFILNPNGALRVVSFGATNDFDVPVPADYDGDGKADLAIFRPSTGQWIAAYSGGGGFNISFGATNFFDLPVPADYEGIGKADLGVFRPSTGQWLIRNSNGSLTITSFGAGNLFDLPLEGPSASLKAAGVIKSVGHQLALGVPPTTGGSANLNSNLTARNAPSTKSATVSSITLSSKSLVVGTIVKVRQWPLWDGSDKIRRSILN